LWYLNPVAILANWGYLCKKYRCKKVDILGMPFCDEPKGNERTDSETFTRPSGTGKLRRREERDGHI